MPCSFNNFMCCIININCKCYKICSKYFHHWFFHYEGFHTIRPWKRQYYGWSLQEEKDGLLPKLHQVKTHWPHIPYLKARSPHVKRVPESGRAQPPLDVMARNDHQQGGSPLRGLKAWKVVGSPGARQWLRRDCHRRSPQWAHQPAHCWEVGTSSDKRDRSSSHNQQEVQKKPKEHIPASNLCPLANVVNCWHAFCCHVPGVFKENPHLSNGFRLSTLHDRTAVEPHYGPGKYVTFNRQDQYFSVWVADGTKAINDVLSLLTQTSWCTGKSKSSSMAYWEEKGLRTYWKHSPRW